MVKKEIWIPNEVGRVQNFEFSELDGLVKVEVDEYPGVITDFVYDGKVLKYEPEKSEVERLKEENKDLKQELEETKADVTNTQIGLAEVYGIIMGGDA